MQFNAQLLIFLLLSHQKMNPIACFTDPICHGIVFRLHISSSKPPLFELKKKTNLFACFEGES